MAGITSIPAFFLLQLILMKTHLHTLENGLRVLLVDTESFPTVTTLILVGAGSRYEDEKNNGIAHFFEHMAFKGSKKYPDALTIASTIDGLGGVFNAFTSKDYTGYWIKAPLEDVSTSFDVLADMTLHPLLREEDIEREKGVISEEINMYEDDPARLIYDYFEQVAYEGNPLAYPIIGTHETIRSFNRETFTDYIASLYCPDNCVVIFAGGLQGRDSDLLDLAKKKMGEWKSHEFPQFQRYTPDVKNVALSIKHKKTEQVHFGLGFRAFSFNDERRFALSVLAAILGKGMSSRLFTEVREKRGLCYYIHTYPDQYADTGMIMTNAGVSKEPIKVKEAIEAVLAEHAIIAKTLVSDQELDRAKEMLLGNTLLSIEDSYAVAGLWGKKLLHMNSIFDLEAYFEKVRAVTNEQVLDLAHDLFTPGNLVISMIGDLKEKDFADVLTWRP